MLENDTPLPTNITKLSPLSKNDNQKMIISICSPENTQKYEKYSKRMISVLLKERPVHYSA
jgi:hypothetical protein